MPVCAHIYRVLFPFIFNPEEEDRDVAKEKKLSKVGVDCGCDTPGQFSEMCVRACVGPKAYLLHGPTRGHRKGSYTRPFLTLPSNVGLT